MGGWGGLAITTAFVCCPISEFHLLAAFFLLEIPWEGDLRGGAGGGETRQTVKERQILERDSETESQERERNTIKERYTEGD